MGTHTADPNAQRTFGGIQLVFCGDFGQLGPIEGRLDPGDDTKHVDRGFAFESHMWRGAEFTVVALTQVTPSAHGCDFPYIPCMNSRRQGCEGYKSHVGYKGAQN